MGTGVHSPFHILLPMGGWGFRGGLASRAGGEDAGDALPQPRRPTARSRQHRPWCAAAIGRRPGSGTQTIDGYQLQGIGDGRSRVMAYCPDPGCAFNPGRQQAAGQKPFGLPVFEVDEDLYTQPPTFVVGTIC